tara:strand:+ start:563 stop:970 length:408 start_codon:yes stop_codon:yes gene_type:complete
MNYDILKDKYNHIALVKEYNNYGNICFYAKNIDLKKLKNKHNEFVNYVYLTCLEALKISKKHKNTTYTVHVYLENVTMKQFSLSLFKKLNKKLEENTEDVLNVCYIYNATPVTKRIFSIIAPILNDDTRNKLIML